MAKEYIEREALLKKLSSIVVTDDFNGTMLAYGIDIATDIILKTSPAADVVEVVRCKDCRFLYPKDNEPVGFYRCDYKLLLTNLDCFCSEGERREK